MPPDDRLSIGEVEHTEHTVHALRKESVDKAVQCVFQRSRSLLRKGSEEQVGEQDELVLKQRIGDFPQQSLGIRGTQACMWQLPGEGIENIPRGLHFIPELTGMPEPARAQV